MAGLQRDWFGQEIDGQAQQEVECGSERLRGGISEELKNLNPVSGADPSILRGLFHPNASTVTRTRCGKMSAILNLG